MLQIVGVDEANVAFEYDFAVPHGVTPIVHDISTEDKFVQFFEPAIQLESVELTTEVEAMLIHVFKPAYNDILFDSYPDIANGTRSVGYTHASLRVEKLPAVLSTRHHTHSGLDGPVELDTTAEEAG